jgi:hypothetical protein
MAQTGDLRLRRETCIRRELYRALPSPVSGLALNISRVSTVLRMSRQRQLRLPELSSRPKEVGVPATAAYRKGTVPLLSYSINNLV